MMTASKRSMLSAIASFAVPLMGIHRAGQMPVVACLGESKTGQVLNINDIPAGQNIGVEARHALDEVPGARGAP